MTSTNHEQAHVPYCTAFQTWIGKTFLRLSGWKVEGELPAINKCVAIYAPHTSNWDFVYMLAIAYALRLNGNWFGKRELFNSPLGPVFRRLGGIPIDRGAKNNRVQITVEAIEREERILLAITPEGTRSKSGYWKSGFYNIAVQAKLPILFMYTDYARKTGGMGPLLEPSGDLERDMHIIREFFSGVTGKYPDEVGQIAVKPRTV